MYEQTCFPTKGSIVSDLYQPSTAVEATPEPKQSYKECDLRMMIPSICLSFEIATIVRLMCALINEVSELDSTCNLNMQFDLDFDFVFKIFNKHF